MTKPMLCSQSPQFLGAGDGGAGVRVRCRPPARICAQAVEVVAGLTRQFILDAPDLFKNRIGFHKSNLP